MLTKNNLNKNNYQKYANITIYGMILEVTNRYNKLCRRPPQYASAPAS